MAASKKLTREQMVDHFNRWIAIYDRIPVDVVSRLRKNHPEWSEDKIKKVANNRAFDFAILEGIEGLIRKRRESLIRRHHIVY
jgi:hypothetical protein